MDVPNLKEEVDKWKKQSPNDKFYLSLGSGNVDSTGDTYIISGVEEEVIPSSSGTREFFFCHQTAFQRHLLHRYGNDMTFLDATYRTTKYALPLFFLAVRTNVGYSVVAEFIVEAETRAAITRGLQTIKQWMDEEHLPWEPACFMTDFCEREISAIEEVFPGCRSYICDFHREQAWLRWVSKADNGVLSSKDTVLALLRHCAQTNSPHEFELAVNQLKQSTVWRNNERLQRWMKRTWLPQCKRWAWAYRVEEGLTAHTNNGVECQNRVFKYKFLADRTSLPLSGMISALLTEYLPDRRRKYIMANSKANSSCGRSYSREVPAYLHNRPPGFVMHCMSRLESAHCLRKKDIERIGEQSFVVKSETLMGRRRYSVTLTDNSLGCDCMDWLRSRRPCKHMFAVMINVEGMSFPSNYLCLPFHMLDSQVESFLEPTHQDVSMEEQVEIADLEDGLEECAISIQKGSILKRTAVSCREKLMLLRDLSYLCSSEPLLLAMEQELTSTILYVRENLFTEGGLIVDERRCQTKKRHRSVSTFKAAQLPIRKRIKKEGFLSKSGIRRSRAKTKRTKKCKAASSEQTAAKDSSGTCNAPETMQTHAADQTGQEPPIKASDEPLCDAADQTGQEPPIKASDEPLCDAADQTGQEPPIKASDEPLCDAADQTGQEPPIKASDEPLCDAADPTGQEPPIKASDEPLCAASSEQAASKDSSGTCNAPKTMQTRNKGRLRQATLKECSRKKFAGGRKHTTSILSGIIIPELEGLKIQPLPSLNDDNRYSVCGETLEIRDFKSLQFPNWINDKILNSFMALLSKEINVNTSGHIFPIPSYAAVHWQRAMYHTWLFKKVNMQKYKWIFLPFNVNKSHWVLLAADVQRGEVSVLDSLPTNPNTSINCIKKFKAYMACRSEKIGDLAGTSWKVGKLQSARQEDGHSCGAFVMLNALAIARGIDPRNVGKYARDMRVYVQNKLTTNAVPPPDQRKTCDMVECLVALSEKPPTSTRPKWVQCDVCGRWLHLYCVSISEAPGEGIDYVCPICCAQYA